MNKLVAGTLVVLALAAGQAIAQTTPAPTQAPAAVAAPAPATAPAVKPAATPAAAPAAAAADAAFEAKFKAADKNNSGVLEGAELDAFKAGLTKIDTDKDGRVSRAEFAAAAKAGLIK